MADPRESVIASIDLTKSGILEMPDLVFLCGGRMDLNRANPSPSFREHLLRWAELKNARLSGRMVLAEQLWKPSADQAYSELITFERHLAELASLIVIFLESPGAIAELAAFSQHPEIASKLCVFIRQSHYNQESFIRLGPVAFMEEQHKEPSSVYVYPWQVATDARGEVIDQDTADKCIEEICADIWNASNRRVSRKIDVNRIRDKLLIILELVGHFLCLKATEIQDYLGRLGIGIEARDLKRFLQVLTTLELLKQVPRGHQKFYVATNPRTFLKFGSAISVEGVDKTRIQFDTRQYYEAEDRARLAAMSKFS